MGKNDGKVEQAKGRVKEAAGSLLDDDDLKTEGQADQQAGEAKEAVSDLAKKASDTASDLIDSVRGKDKD